MRSRGEDDSAPAHWCRSDGAPIRPAHNEARVRRQARYNCTVGVVGLTGILVTVKALFVVVIHPSNI